MPSAQRLTQGREIGMSLFADGAGISSSENDFTK
jgi:hypothetical protein